jgi:hypothetical protein
MSNGFQPQDVGQSLQPSAPQSPVTPVQQIGNNVYMTGFQDESVKQYEFELYSGRVGQTDRIYLIRPTKILKTRRHFHEKTKFILCNSTYVRNGDHEMMTHEAECCKRLGSNNLTFGVLVVRYITDKQGTLVRPFLMPELRLWRMGVDKYLQLKAIDKEWPLADHDLTANCSDEKYQKMTLGAVRQCIYKLPDFPPEIKTQFEQWADTSLPKLPREMGKTMTDAEILAALGQATGAPPTMQASDAPITDFSSIVGGLTSNPPPK